VVEIIPGVPGARPMTPRKGDVFICRGPLPIMVVAVPSTDHIPQQHSSFAAVAAKR